MAGSFWPGRGQHVAQRAVPRRGPVAASGRLRWPRRDANAHGDSRNC